MSWRIAAGAVANKVDKWSKENYARLIEKRTQNSTPSTPAQQAQASATGPVSDPAPEKPAGDTTITPGMTTDEVTKAMGDPQKKVTFGQKSMWTYKGMQVVFENGKVTDVKF
jgi:hypothetical protein